MITKGPSLTLNDLKRQAETRKRGKKEKKSHLIDSRSSG
jgi:hypothetical protein